MTAPGNMPQMAPKDGEEAKNFNAEQSERENVRGGGKPRSEHCGRHKRRIRRERGWESAVKSAVNYVQKIRHWF